MLHTEKSSTEVLLRDADYHLARLQGDENTAELATNTVDAIERLRAIRREVDSKKVIEKTLRDTTRVAVKNLLMALRYVRNAVTMAVEFDRNSPGYRAIWPQGADWINNDVGDTLVGKAEELAHVLGRYFPAIADLHGDQLNQAIQRVKNARRSYLEARVTVGGAFRNLVHIRAELTDKMRANKGLILGIYPRDRNRRGKFFRTGRKNGRHADDSAYRID